MPIRTYALKDRVNGVSVCEMCGLKIPAHSAIVRIGGMSLTAQHYDCPLNKCVVPGYEDKKLNNVYPRLDVVPEARREWEEMSLHDKSEMICGTLRGIRSARRNRYRSDFDDYGTDDSMEDDGTDSW